MAQAPRKRTGKPSGRISQRQRAQKPKSNGPMVMAAVAAVLVLGGVGAVLLKGGEEGGDNGRPQASTGGDNGGPKATGDTGGGGGPKATQATQEGSPPTPKAGPDPVRPTASAPRELPAETETTPPEAPAAKSPLSALNAAQQEDLAKKIGKVRFDNKSKLMGEFMSTQELEGLAQKELEAAQQVVTFNEALKDRARHLANAGEEQLYWKAVLTLTENEAEGYALAHSYANGGLSNEAIDFRLKAEFKDLSRGAAAGASVFGK